MSVFRTAVCAALIAITPFAANAHWGEHHGWRHHGGYRSLTLYSPPPREPGATCGLGLTDSRGRLRRCAFARASFVRDNPCPSTGDTRGPCPGYVVDHIVPLKRGGADDESNMQWQTIEDAKAKDRVE